MLSSMHAGTVRVWIACCFRPPPPHPPSLPPTENNECEIRSLASWHLFISPTPFLQGKVSRNFLVPPQLIHYWQLCYLTVVFTTAASQNVFSTFKLFLHTKKTNIIKKITKNIRFVITFICYHRAVGDRALYEKICWVIQALFCDAAVQRLQNPPFCSSTSLVS